MPDDFLETVRALVGVANVLTTDTQTLPYTQGWRYGAGRAVAVIFPQSLLQQWQVLQACVQHDKIILMQASNTSLTGGATPDGDDYDRDIVIIKSEKIKHPHIIQQGQQVIAFPGTTLPQLETILSQVGREIHSVLGSTCVGASVIGGVCNNSGGALVQRGPVYTELSIYAHVDGDGHLKLVNNIGIPLGDTPEDILTRIEAGDFNFDDLPTTNKKASSDQYQREIRQIDSPTPARYNANPDYLYESSGSAGKIAVFAVRIDTFPAKQKLTTFHVATNDFTHLNYIRRHMLEHFDDLPVMAEYMDKDSIHTIYKFAFDTYILLWIFGQNTMPKFLRMKNKVEAWFSKIPLVNPHVVDKILCTLGRPFIFILPRRFRNLSDDYDHHLFLQMADDGIDKTHAYLSQFCSKNQGCTYYMGTDREQKTTIDIRFIFGVATTRLPLVQNKNHYFGLSYDVAYARNDSQFPNKIYPDSIKNAIVKSCQASHFFCHVAHEFYMIDSRLCDKPTADEAFLQLFRERLAKFPAEHNVGQKYHAHKTLQDFYAHLDPTNHFNAGVGKMSKNKFYQ